MIDKLLSAIAPHLCISCGTLGTVLCIKCKYDIIRSKYTDCLVCNRVHLINGDTTCSSTWFVGERKAALQRLIGSYKFNGLRVADVPLAELLTEAAPPFPSNAVVTWIPTSPKHIRERGYDHMHRIAKLFAGLNDMNATQLLSRTKYFVQHKSDRKTRFTQADGAFISNRNLDPSRTYILLDDVYTTGATITAAEAALRSAGAKVIIVGVIARQTID